MITQNNFAVTFWALVCVAVLAAALVGCERERQPLYCDDIVSVFDQYDTRLVRVSKDAFSGEQAYSCTVRIGGLYTSLGGDEQGEFRGYGPTPKEAIAAALLNANKNWRGNR